MVTAEFLLTGPPDGPLVVLAHGAGVGMDSNFMTAMAERLAAQGARTARFEFAYMAERRSTGRRPPPPTAEALTSEYQAALDRLGERRPFIGGKSLGGRVASLIADRLHAAGRIGGLVCLGYPFHPPDRPERLRTRHLETLACPAIIVQGERDPFGSRQEVAGYRLSPAVRIAWSPLGDHHLAPPKGSGRPAGENWDEAAKAVAAFMREHAS